MPTQPSYYTFKDMNYPGCPSIAQWHFCAIFLQGSKRAKDSGADIRPFLPLPPPHIQNIFSPYLRWSQKWSNLMSQGLISAHGLRNWNPVFTPVVLFFIFGDEGCRATVTCATAKSSLDTPDYYPLNFWSQKDRQKATHTNCTGGLKKYLQTVLREFWAVMPDSHSRMRINSGIIPFVAGIEITMCIHELQIPSPGKIWHRSDQTKPQGTPLKHTQHEGLS